MADGEQTAQTARNTQADGVQDAAGNQGGLRSPDSAVRTAYGDL